MSERSEEKYPLLLLFTDDGGKNRHQRFAFERNRANGITSGATTIMTQWPGHLASCLLTALFLGFTMLLLTTVLVLATNHHRLHSLRPRCIGKHVREDGRMDNQTIHLVHGPNHWCRNQLQALEDIANKFPSCKIHLVMIQEDSVHEVKRNGSEATDSTTVEAISSSSLASSVASTVVEVVPVEKIRVKRSRINKKWMRKHTSPKRKKRMVTSDPDNLEVNINLGSKKLLNVLLNHRRNKQASSTSTMTPTTTTTATLDDIRQKYPKIFVERLSYEDAFRNSPLYNTWRNLNDHMRLFAIRVLDLWQYAGLSFELPDDHDDRYKYETDSNTSTPGVVEIDTEAPGNAEKLGKFIQMGFSSYSKLPEGVVTVDDEGLHMETKTSCHAFFGEVLMALRKANRSDNPSDILKKTLAVFCMKRAVDPKYCRAQR